MLVHLERRGEVEARRAARHKKRDRSRPDAGDAKAPRSDDKHTKGDGKGKQKGKTLDHSSPYQSGLCHDLRKKVRFHSRIQRIFYSV